MTTKTSEVDVIRSTTHFMEICQQIIKRKSCASEKEIYLYVNIATVVVNKTPFS